MTTSSNNSHLIPISKGKHKYRSDEYVRWMISSSPPKICDICPATQIPSREFDKAIFSVGEGYREGYILSNWTKIYRVHFYRDENGCEIEDIRIVPKSCRVNPYRRIQTSIWIQIHPRFDHRVNGTGFIRAHHPIEVGYGIGAGVNGKIPKEPNKSCSANKYPIYIPLTFHSNGHRKTLTHASNIINQIIIEYIQLETISWDLLDRACWLVNVVLYVDGFPNISDEVLLEAISNFAHDYSNLPSGTILRQPINYIFDIVGIDGVCCNELSKINSRKHKYSAKRGNLPSVSFISTDYEGIIYTSQGSETDLSNSNSREIK